MSRPDDRSSPPRESNALRNTLIGVVVAGVFGIIAAVAGPLVQASLMPVQQTPPAATPQRPPSADLTPSTGAPPALPTTAAPTSPTMTVDPPSAAPGATVAISGSAFVPRSALTLRLYSTESISFPLVDLVVVGSDGAFRTEASLPDDADFCAVRGEILAFDEGPGQFGEPPPRSASDAAVRLNIVC